MYPRKEFDGPRDFWRKVSTELKRRGQEKKRREESKRIYLIKPGWGGGGGGGRRKQNVNFPGGLHYFISSKTLLFAHDRDQKLQFRTSVVLNL